MSLAVAGFFWSRGAWMVLLFSVLELLAVARAFLVYARHATDGEHICFSQGRLVVEREDAGRLRRHEWAGYGVRVEDPVDRDRLVTVYAGACAVEVGRFLRPDLRPLLAREIRQALRLA